MVPVIRSKDRPTKSAPLISRLFKRNVGISASRITWPAEISKAIDRNVNTFVFIDDFLGTGNQFDGFAEEYDLKATLAGCTAIYAPLVAHESGLDHLANKHPWLHTCTVERLTACHSLFSPESTTFLDGYNTPEMAQVFYHEMLSRRDIEFSDDYVEGYGSLALTYVFEHSTPNNCIPLLWHDKNWKPLFNR